MSANLEFDQSERVRCEACGQRGPQYEYHHGKYCSNTCEYRAVGEDVLRLDEFQSRFCSSCYRPIRDIEPIPERVHRGGDGYQYPTPNTVIGVDDFSPNPYDRLERTRWSCACGAVNADSGPIAELQNVELRTVQWNLWWALRWLLDRDHVESVSFDAYFGSLNEHPRDAALAVGRAVTID